MPVACSQLIKGIEEMYPRRLAESYDNVGLILGDEGKEIRRVLVALEVNDDIVDEAIASSADMIITHHPLIFTPIKRIVKSDHLSSLIIRLLNADINLYSLHTNFDNSPGGMNDILAGLLGLVNTEPLSNNWPLKLYKLVVFVPETHHDLVMGAILGSGAGHIGNYSHCSFNINGIGTFLPLSGAEPYLGRIGSLERAQEVRVETIVDESRLQGVVANMLKAHPYEEVAYDIYPLNNTLQNGTGRVGELKASISFAALCEALKQSLNIPWLSIGGDTSRQISRIAIVGGAGMDFLDDAVNKGADVLITGDIKHHEALEAVEKGINIIDAGHYLTEVISLPYISNLISRLGDVECSVTMHNTNQLKRI